MNNDLKKSGWSIAVAIIMGDIFLVAAGIFFYRNIIGSQKQEVLNLRQQLHEREERRELAKERQTLLVSWKESSTRLGTFFFTPDQLVPWFEFLETEARNQGLRFEASTLADADNAASPATTGASPAATLGANPQLRAVVRGGFAPTVAFLRAIESGPYALKVENYSGEKGEGEIISYLTLQFYGKP